MESDLITFVSVELRKLPLKEWKPIAEAAGVPYSTAYKYAYGYTKRPSYDAVSRLAAELKRRAA
jgi:predicted transcriptional regulator